MKSYQTLMPSLLENTGAVLSLDIGSGTQDALLALPNQHPENWPRFVLPAPAQYIAQRIRACTAAQRSVWLYGNNMGGGFTDALREQVAQGLRPAVSSSASKAIHDNPERVLAANIAITEHCPQGSTAIALADYDAGFWQSLLSTAQLPMPNLVLAAVQDHGCHADTGNREGRFRLWKQRLEQSQGDPSQWLFTTPPTPATRLHALQTCTGGLVADTGTAAVLGALATPEVRQRSQRQGVTIVNMGNSHIIAFLVFRERILGIYEHHTGLRDQEALLFDLKEFKFGWLPDEQVRAQGGHGCTFLAPLPEEAEGFAPTFILGPQRECLRGHGQFIAPCGDMMLAGCHGLLYGLALQHSVASA